MRCLEWQRTSLFKYKADGGHTSFLWPTCDGKNSFLLFANVTIRLVCDLPLV
jgi:hypothetical protein